MTPEQERLIATLIGEIQGLRREMAARGTLAPAPTTAKRPSPAPNGSAPVADDRDLDGKFGDESIERLPKSWEGERLSVPRKMSDGPPEFLDCYAAFKDWCAGKDDESGATDEKGRPKGGYSRKSAARARGWAARLRSGWTAKGTAPAGASRRADPAPVGDAFDDCDDGSDSLPF